MKKTTIIAAILFACFSNAQISKGSKMIGASLGFGSIGGSDSKTTYSNTSTAYDSKSSSMNIGINPSVGFFIADGFAIGGQAYLAYYTSKSNSSNTGSAATTESVYNNPSFSLGPYARYYFIKDQKMSPYLQGEFNGSISPTKNTYTSSTGSSSTSTGKGSFNWDAGMKFGFEYFISEYVGLQMYTGFTYAKSTYETDYVPSTGTGYSYTNEYKRWNVPVGVGLQIHLPSKSTK